MITTTSIVSQTDFGALSILRYNDHKFFGIQKVERSKTYPQANATTIVRIHMHMYTYIYIYVYIYGQDGRAARESAF